MIPVIFIHTGPIQEYVLCTIKQALKNNSVYLLGDVRLDLNETNFNFCNINELKTDYNKFEVNYEHLNTTPLDYEKFCYKRWFLLKEFMHQNNINLCFYVDSDVILMNNITEDWVNYSQYEMTLLHRSAAVSSYITYESICKFCEMLISVYADKNSYYFKKIKSHYLVRNQCGLTGGVCDMTLLELFHYTQELGGGPGRIGEMMQIINDCTYDHNINVADQDFSMKNNMKNVKIRNNQIYVYNERLKKDIKFNSLHFQGQAKCYIPYFVNKLNDKL